MKIGITLNDVSRYTSLFIYKDSVNKNHAELVTKIPDEKYLNDTTFNRKFSGIVSVTDWYGNYLRGYKYEKGIAVNAIGAPENFTESNKTVSVNALKANSQNCTEYTYVIATPSQQQANNIKINQDYADVSVVHVRNCYENSSGSHSVAVDYGNYGWDGNSSGSYSNSNGGYNDDCGYQDQSYKNGKIKVLGCNERIAELLYYINNIPGFSEWYDATNAAEKILCAAFPSSAIAVFRAVQEARAKSHQMIRLNL